MESGVEQHGMHLLPLPIIPGNVEFTIPKSKSVETMARKASPTLSHNGFSKSDDQTDWVGKLDISMYQEDISEFPLNYPPNHRGRLWYGLTYDLDAERLVITLVKARNLPPSNKRYHEPPDCFIKLCLIPDNRRTLQTGMKKKTLNPKFDESFVFQLNSKDVDERWLELSVQQVQSRSKPYPVGKVFIGLEEIIMKQRKLAETSAERATRGISRGISHWIDILDPKQDRTSTRSKGQILLSLLCHTVPNTCRFFVGIHQCQNICAQEVTAPCDVQVKVEFRVDNKHQKTKKTSAYHHVPGNEIIISESIRFSVSDPQQLTQGNLIVTLVHKSLLRKDKFLGRLCIGSSYMLAKSHGLEHWQRMLDKPNEEHIAWHDLS